MPISYDIHPELNLIIYICTDIFTGGEFFKVGDIAAHDTRLKNEMKIIIDLFSAEIETSLSDLHLAIAKNKELKQKGHEVGKTAVITKSTSLNFLGDALKLMSHDSPSNFGIFNNRHDAIRWLELPEKETMLFWDSAEIKASEKSPVDKKRT